ncbi:MAG: acyl-CoA dehydrogenase family protein [Pseudomonadota bacterium]
MNFELTEERQMLQDTLRRYLSDKYTTDIRNKILDSDQGYSSEIWTELAELGVIGALFSEDEGGFGGQGFDISVVFEEFGRAGVVEPFLDTAVLCGGVISALGDADQKGLVEEIIGGGLQLAFAHGEPSSRYDLNWVHTRVSEGKLTGRKAVVVNAEAADHLVVSAREGDGISLYLVARDAPGLTLRGYPMMAGGRAAEVTLEETPGTALGAPGAALPAIEAAVAAANVAMAAEVFGAMTSATELTGSYLMTRQQFGRPIGTFQALQHRMADLLIELEQARSAVINAAGHLEAEPRARDLEISAARNLMGRVGRLVAEESIQMHGGIAMTREYELAHIAKRIIMSDHRFGDTDYHLERFIDLSAAA